VIIAMEIEIMIGGETEDSAAMNLLSTAMSTIITLKHYRREILDIYLI
jgi:hypothetical protein